MNDFFYNSEIKPRSAQEVAMQARRLEKQQAVMNAEFAADARTEGKRKRSFLDWLILLLGSPRQF